MSEASIARSRSRKRAASLSSCEGSSWKMDASIRVETFCSISGLGEFYNIKSESLSKSDGSSMYHLSSKFNPSLNALLFIKSILFGQRIVDVIMEPDCKLNNSSLFLGQMGLSMLEREEHRLNMFEGVMMTLRL